MGAALYQCRLNLSTGAIVLTEIDQIDRLFGVERTHARARRRGGEACVVFRSLACTHSNDLRLPQLA